jgi:hypothetical protein
VDIFRNADGAELGMEFQKKLEFGIQNSRKGQSGGNCSMQK